MPPYSWKKAKDLLTPVEKDRICCLLFTCIDQVKPTSADFKKAAEQFDAAQGGFTKMYQTTLKKLKENNAFLGAEGDSAEEKGDEQNSDAPKTPSGKRKKAGKEDADGSPAKKRTPGKKNGV